MSFKRKYIWYTAIRVNKCVFNVSKYQIIFLFYLYTYILYTEKRSNALYKTVIQSVYYISCIGTHYIVNLRVQYVLQQTTNKIHYWTITTKEFDTTLKVPTSLFFFSRKFVNNTCGSLFYYYNPFNGTFSNFICNKIPFNTTM